ncbi:chemotaxis protein CheC [Longirhabdus pacifica]|uniref:chemotaxis protein CheC n=1 Tax=Longirhabdus pacifica TaxID=2305227 RepID=UPI0010087702|nr:chemotaxis protein CheC [Longirhabdus pacifica]
MHPPENVPAHQLDILKELGNIGSGHAATALSQLLNKRVDMQVPFARSLSFNEIVDIVGGADHIVVAIYLRMDGEAPGNIYFILEVDSAKRLLAHFTQIHSANNKEFTTLEYSALSEIGNILAGSYLTSLMELTNLYMSLSVPQINIDMAGAVLNDGLIPFGTVGDQALLIDSTFKDGKQDFDARFILIPDPSSYEKIFLSLGVAMHE